MMLTTHFKQRLFIGSLGILGLIFSIYYSYTSIFKPFFILLMQELSVSLVEYYHLALTKGYYPSTYLGFFCSIAYVISLAFNLLHPSLNGLPSLILLGSLFLFFLNFFYRQPLALGNLAVTVFGLAYVEISLSSVIGIIYFFPPGSTEDGDSWLAYVLIISKMSDIGAYFFGKTIGKTKLSPSISPKKTVEGAIGGY